MYMIYNMISMMMIISLIMMFLYLINFFLSMMKKMNREKNTPFECGFNPQSNARLPFSTQFFLITLMFLIFDIEIMLILPSIFLMKYKMLFLSICLMFFSIFMSISLMLEWMYSMLNWIF